MWIHRYTLTLRGGPGNARSQRRTLEGALVRDGAGYGCIHPWPELGDAPLEDQLAALRAGNSTPILDRMRECLGRDAAARGCP